MEAPQSLIAQFGLLGAAIVLQERSMVDSILPSTCEHWRRRMGMPEEVVTDPRPLAEALAAVIERDGTVTIGGDSIRIGRGAA